MSKTNAVRILELWGIPHNILEYELNENEIDAVSVARKINAEADSVFKTLVTFGDKTGHCVFVIPGSFNLDLKKAALASRNKKAEMIKEKELFAATGYIKGGCSPIGMKKSYPIYIDETALLWERIYVSGGIRGIQINLSPLELAKIVNAYFVDLI